MKYDDDLNPARGLIWGVILGFALYSLIIGVWWLAS